jgi:outer membrane autotransporter protein
LSSSTQTVKSGGKSEGTIIDSGSVENVAGISTGSEVQDGGEQVVENGGVANDTEVKGGGEQTVESGGKTVDTVLTGDVNGEALQTVESGGTATGTEINNDGRQVVDAGGTANNTEINNGGVQEVYGKSDGSVVDSGGRLEVYQGSTVTNTDLQGGTMALNNNTSVSNTTVDNNSTLEVGSGASTTGTVIVSGKEEVLSGGSSTGAKINGGTQDVEGTVNTATVNSGGTQNIKNGGVSNNTTINNGGVQNVANGGTSDGDIIKNGGTQNITAGATVVDTSIDGGEQVLNSGVIVTGAEVKNSGKQTVNSGGTAKETIIISGEQFVDVGGKAEDTEVRTGGVQSVYGEIEDTRAISGGSVVLYDNSIVSGTDNKIEKYSNLYIAESGTINGTGTINLASGTVRFGEPGVPMSDYIRATLNPTLAGTGLLAFNLGDIDGSGNYNDHIVLNNATGSYEIVINHTGSTYLAQYDLITLNSGSATFALSGGKVDIGLYEYTLVKTGNEVSLIRGGASGGGGNRYASFVYELPAVADAALQTVNALSNSMHKRLGELQWQVNNKANAIPHEQQALWVRTTYSNMELDETVNADVDMWGVEFGYDYQIPGIDYKNGDFFIGMLAQVGKSDVDFNQKFTQDGNADIDAHAVGLYAMWLGKGGWYADAVLRHYWVKQKVSSWDTSGNMTRYKFDQTAVTGSIEFGRQWVSKDICANDICDAEAQWFVTPKAQFSTTLLRGDDDVTNTGYRVKIEDNNSYIFNLGIMTGARYYAGDTEIQPYVKAGLAYEFDARTNTYFDTIKQSTDQRGLRYELGAGVNARLYKNASAHFDLNWQEGEKIKNLTLNAGFRYEFGGDMY